MINEQTIEDGNKLIAEFIGCKIDKKSYNYWWYEMDNGTFGYGHQLNYHSSWNWLMPVIEKIESLGYTVQIAGNSCGIHDNNADIDEDFNHIGMESFFFENDSKIMSTWNAIIVFIEYYNEKNPTQ